jgi:hypothetical protein
MAQIDEKLWGELWEGWIAWHKRHGPDYFRLGTPSKVQLMAANRANVQLPLVFPNI